MLHSVVRGEVENSISNGRLHHHRVNIAAGPIGQEHGTSLGAQREHVLRAIILFVTTRALVLAN